MALPSSGQISMGDINVELDRTRTTTGTELAGDSTPTSGSLFGIATSSVNKIAPHKISEFHGYTHPEPNNAYVEGNLESPTCNAAIGTVRGPCDWNQSISSELKALFEAGSNFNFDSEGVTIPGFGSVTGNLDYGIIAYSVTVGGVGQIRKKRFSVDDDDNVEGITTCSTYDPSC